jgi:hypothetical protein
MLCRLEINGGHSGISKIALGHSEVISFHLQSANAQTDEHQITRTQLTDSGNHGAEAVGLLPPAVGRFDSGSRHNWYGIRAR